MKKLLLISLIFTCFSANAQLGQGYNAKYRPLTFEDYMRPAMIYDQARSKEVDRFDNYMDKLSEQCSSDYPNYGLIKFYSNRCLEINNSRMFNGELCDNGVLYYLRGVSQIELGERQEGINDLRRASQYGYQPAQKYLAELNYAVNNSNTSYRNNTNNTYTTNNNYSSLNSGTLEFQTKKYNYGKIRKGSNGNGEISFKNTSNQPASIINVRTNCGCLIPSYSKEIIYPGQSSSIKFRYNTNNVGSFDKTITIELSNGTKVTLQISGEVLSY